MSSSIASLQEEYERTITQMQQTIETYIHGHPELTTVCIFLLTDQEKYAIRRAAAQASLTTGRPIDLIYTPEMRQEKQV